MFRFKFIILRLKALESFVFKGFYCIKQYQQDDTPRNAIYWDALEPSSLPPSSSPSDHGAASSIIPTLNEWGLLIRQQDTFLER